MLFLDIISESVSIRYVWYFTYRYYRYLKMFYL